MNPKNTEEVLSKTLLKLCLVIAIWASVSGLAFANQSVDLGGPSSGVELLSQDNSGLTLQMNISKVDFEPVSTPDGDFTMIVVKDFSRSHNIGEPNLPMVNRLLDIPFKSDLTTDIINSQFEEISLSDLGITNPIIPTQPSLSKSANPQDVPFRYNRASYQEDRYYALPLVNTEIVGTMRSVHIGMVELAPIQYNPVKNSLRVYKQLTVRVNYQHPDYALTDQMREKYYSPAFETVYHQLFNYQTPPPQQLDDLVTYPIKYVIVADRMFESQLQPFIQWKTEKGFTVVVGYTDEIGYSNTAIKSWIENIYNNSNPPEDPAPSFVLLVGDTPQIPPFNGTAGSHITDLYFCEFTGDDLPEIYYGRFSAQSTSELQPQIDKTLEHEQYTMPDPSYQAEVTLIAGVDAGYAPTWGNGQINYGTNLYFNAAHGITDHTWLYPASDDPGASAAIIQTVNDGIGFLNYTAHGSHDGFYDPSFTRSDVNGLTNADKYPLVIGNCCLTNTFGESTPCFGEVWLQVADKGAIGYIGGSNSTYWDEDYWWGVGNGPIDGNGPDYSETGLGAYDGLFHDHGEAVSDWYTTNDAVIFRGDLAVTESGSSMTLYYWEVYHLMGDPSVMTYLGQATANNVVHNNVIPLGSNYFTVSADPNSYVGISMNGVLHGAAYIDESGTVDVPIDPFMDVGDAKIIVTAQNKIPYIATVPVIGEGYGAIGGRLTDMVSGEGLEGTVTVTDHDPEIVGHCNEEGYYIIYVPADTVWHLRAEYTSDYLPSFADLSVSEGDTLEYDFALEPKVAVVLKASFGNPSDIGYRTFYCRGSWDADGFYDAGWDAPFTPMRDDGVAPDEMAGDGIFTGVVLLATDLSHTYSWAVYSEDYNDEASRLQDGADFDVSDPGTPPDVPVLEVNPSGSEHNWTLTLFNTESGLSVDMLPGYGGLPYVWYATVNVPPGYETTHCLVKAMHSEVSTYGDGGVGGSPIELTFPEPGNYTVYFNDDNDITTTGASLIAQPNWLEVELTPGSSTTRELVLRNEGGLDLNFTIPDDFGDKVVMGGAPAPDPGPFTRYRYTGPKTASVDEFVGTPVVMGSGGPDDYGYKWMDSDEPGGPTYNWVEISGTGTPLNMGDDDNMGPYSLPFTFNYYGNNYSAFRVCSNGWISFTSTSTSYWNEEIPSSDAPGNMIAPMWDDMNPSAGGQVYYYISSDTAIVEWSGVPHYYDDGSYTYEVILTSGNAIFFQYQNLSGDVNSATVGIQNGDGSDGLQVVYNAAYLHDELAVRIAAGWLDVSPLSGVIPAGGQVDLTVVFDAGALLVGDYSGTITVQSWDEIQSLPDMLIPVSLHVEDVVPTIDLAMHPDDEPVVVPAGGSFDYTISVSNTTGGSLNYDGWLMLTLPDGSDYGPLAEISTSISGGETEYYFLTQDIPSFAPLGDYNYRAYVGDYPSAVIDGASFPFTVVSGAGSADGWDVIGFDPSILRGGVETALPRSYTLSQNYPNPFNAESVIEYGLPSGGDVELVVFNLLGQRVETLVNGYRQAGYHSVIWDASHYSSGIYFYKLTANGKTLTKRMTLLK